MFNPLVADGMQSDLNVSLNLSQLQLLQEHAKCAEYSNVAVCSNSSWNYKSSSVNAATLETVSAWWGFFVQPLAAEECAIFRGMVKWTPLTCLVLAVRKNLCPRPFMRDSALTSNLADYPEFRDYRKALIFS